MLRLATYLFAAMLLLVQRAEARLWDSKDQVDAMYGRSVKSSTLDSGEKEVRYRYKDFDVIVTFFAGKSDFEYYCHRDPKRHMKPNEIRLFLNMNSVGKHWAKCGEFLWRLGSSEARTSKATAVYFLPGFALWTSAYAKRHEPHWRY